ncbi:ricin B lectin domain-containing protein [Mycena belliarum]|uniref:Ricin B lectin domain-containing protein n=1 Tax=Mycena belliarum TaxID=1033014 RepID=A0AAD6U6W2_9AGAR|nr:ricin B lectin domain-containing protein [Mycena belliae]
MLAASRLALVLSAAVVATASSHEGRRHNGIAMRLANGTEYIEKRDSFASKDMTWYNTDTGADACTGKNHQDGDFLVAMGYDQFGDGSGCCGRKLRINYNGKSAVATCVDRCASCPQWGQIDLTKGLFEYLTGDLGIGLIHASWSYVDGNDNGGDKPPPATTTKQAPPKTTSTTQQAVTTSTTKKAAQKQTTTQKEAPAPTEVKKVAAAAASLSDGISTSASTVKTVSIIAVEASEDDKASPFCMAAASDKSHAAVALVDCGNFTSTFAAGNATWSTALTPNSKAAATITTFGGAMCLDVTDGVVANGTKVQVWKCAEGNTNQKFTASGQQIRWAGNGSHPEMCLDLTDGKAKAGNPVQIWDCAALDDNVNQHWAMTKL